MSEPSLEDEEYDPAFVKKLLDMEKGPFSEPIPIDEYRKHIAEWYKTVEETKGGDSL